MMHPERIREIIEAGLPDCSAIVNDNAGDREHFQAEVVSSAFVGLSLVRQHQLVYKTLGDHMKSDIHALALKTYTPDRWAESHAEVK